MVAVQSSPPHLQSSPHEAVPALLPLLSSPEAGEELLATSPMSRGEECKRRLTSPILTASLPLGNFILFTGNPTPCSLLISFVLKVVAGKCGEDAGMKAARLEPNPRARRRRGRRRKSKRSGWRILQKRDSDSRMWRLLEAFS